MKTLKKSEFGGAMVEFVLILPVLLLMCIGLYEVRNYMYISIKLDEIAAKVADWSASNTKQSAINDHFIGAWNMGAAFNFGTLGKIYVTGVQNNGTNNKAVWTVFTSGATTVYGGLNANVTLPSPLTLASGDAIIIVEIKYTYSPITPYLSFLQTATISTTAFAVPRGNGTFNPLPA